MLDPHAASEERFICSFDMSREVILITPFPEVAPSYYHDKCKFVIVPFDESIGLIRFEGPLINDEGGWEGIVYTGFDIWSLGEYGIKQSWNKLFTITLGPFKWPLGFWKNINKVFFASGEGEVLIYDHSKHEIKKTGIFGVRHELQVFTYEPNLVPIAGIKCCSYDHWMELISDIGFMLTEDDFVMTEPGLSLRIP